MSRKSIEDVLRASMGPDEEPAADGPRESNADVPPAIHESVATGSVAGMAVVAGLDDMGFASAAGAASGAYRLLDLVSIGVPPGGEAAAVAKAQQLLVVALWQIKGAQAIRARRAAAK